MHPQHGGSVDLEEIIASRTSIRAFKSDPIDDSTIDVALRLANQAPSAGNLQARDFIVVRNSHTRRMLAEAAFKQDFIRTAPVVIVCCANLERIKSYGDRGRTLYCLQDVAAGIENMMLYLHSKGLGTVWVGAFNEEKVTEAVMLPESARPVALVPIGYPVGKGVRRTRLLREQYIHYEKW
jgi:nitroreductase